MKNNNVTQPETTKGLFTGIKKLLSKAEIIGDTPKIDKNKKIHNLCKSNRISEGKTQAFLQRETREKKLYTIIGNNIRTLRRQNNLTAGKVAELIGVTPQQFIKYEKAINRISIPSLFIIGEKFNISINWFFYEGGQL